MVKIDTKVLETAKQCDRIKKGRQQNTGARADQFSLEARLRARETAGTRPGRMHRGGRLQGDGPQP